MTSQCPAVSSFLDKVFKIKQNNSTIGTEIVAGCATFFTMVYIAFVNPSILSSSGMDSKAVFVLTCLISALASILMGLIANLPIALAPAMGLNAFFTYGVVLSMGYSWKIAMGAVFWGSFCFFLLSLLKIRHWIIASIPLCLRVGIGSGIGLFMTFMGLQNMKLIVSSEATLLKIGDLLSLNVGLGILGFFIIVVLSAKKFPAAILAAIIIITIIALILDPTVFFSGIFSSPPTITSVVGQVNITDVLNAGLIGVIFSFTIVSLFDSSSTILALTDRAKMIDQTGQFRNMNKALLIDSFSSTLGGLLGTSSVLAYIESSAGIAVGGRTGLTAIVTGFLFLITLFLSPLAEIVPPYATAGALIYVGILMASSLTKIDWEDLTESTPGFITALMMPFSFAITEAVAFGFISYAILKILTGRFREINSCVVVVALLFLTKFIFIDH